MVYRPKFHFITSNFAPNEWYGRNGEKKFHSSHEDAGTTVVVEKAFDCSALMRRLTPPMGDITEMKQRFVPAEEKNDDFDIVKGVIDVDDDETAVEMLNGLIDLTTPPSSPVHELDDNPYENYQDGDGDGEYDADDDVDEDWENEEIPVHSSPQFSLVADLNKAQALKRTDEFTFRKPEQARALFKKLGSEPVQSKLAWAPKKRKADDDDDDVDDKIENSQKK